jgi:hypothetical protein
MSNWIPALHAGMTQSRVLLELTEGPPSRIFKEGREGREGRMTERDTLVACYTRSFLALMHDPMRQVWI